MYEIQCKELTPERRRLLAPREVASIGRPIRIILGAGGVYLFYYGTNGQAPAAFQNAAIAFSIIGIAAVLLAIFSQKLVDTRFFAKALKKGCFPSGASAGEGGVFVRRAVGAGSSGAGAEGSGVGAEGVTSVNAERFFAYAEVGRVEEFDEYFKMSLLSGEAPGVFLFKEDFTKGDPEAFLAYIDSKRRA